MAKPIKHVSLVRHGHPRAEFACDGASFDGPVLHMTNAYDGGPQGNPSDPAALLVLVLPPGSVVYVR